MTFTFSTVNHELFLLYGGAEGIRTPGLIRARDALSQLSYCPSPTLCHSGRSAGIYNIP